MYRNLFGNDIIITINDPNEVAWHVVLSTTNRQVVYCLSVKRVNPTIFVHGIMSCSQVGRLFSIMDSRLDSVLRGKSLEKFAVRYCSVMIRPPEMAHAFFVITFYYFSHFIIFSPPKYKRLTIEGKEGEVEVCSTGQSYDVDIEKSFEWLIQYYFRFLNCHRRFVDKAFT